MAEFVLVAASGVAFVSLCLSTVSLLVHYAKRGENPLLGPLEAEIQALKLGQADLVDRVEHFVKRTNARRTRDQVEEPLQQPALPMDLPHVKQQLRGVARERGIIR